MGSFLHDALGADYLPIALIGYNVRQVSGTSPPLQTNPLSVERRLHGLDRRPVISTHPFSGPPSVLRSP
jgi:hypothetical protein